MTSILDIPGDNPPKPFLVTFSSVFTSTSLGALDEIADQIVETVTVSSDPNTKPCELWDAFFTTVVTHPNSLSALLIFLGHLKTQSPATPANVRLGSNIGSYLRSHLQRDGRIYWSLLPGYHSQWRETYDILEAWRDWDGVRASGAPSLDYPVAMYFLRFCDSSAAESKATDAERQGALTMCVFNACRDVLERSEAKPQQAGPHRTSSDQLWALDVRVTATWLRDGAQTLWETDSEALHCSTRGGNGIVAAKHGLTKERWRLWLDEIRSLATDREHFDQMTRVIIAEAADVVGELLQCDPFQHST
ncbi:hypothetical protein D6D01_02790 [Aureobasidium pullulans]|uniref:Uncharacterized protein n=1 Tax=Aureobasidium pullulans TaxID=5580 RepID=A0A4S9LQA8_AURPU|nr:hypothetical protein D6D01_02790 [Aureobasidium pullulans]